MQKSKGKSECRRYRVAAVCRTAVKGMKTIRYIQCILLVLLAVSCVLGVPRSDKTSKCGGSSTVENYSRSLGPKARNFLANLTAAVNARDKQKVAAMVQYPLRVNSGKGHRVVRNSSEFVRDYDRLFTPAIRKAIDTQVPDCLFANWQGVMIGNGEVWFGEQTDGTLRIETLNIK